VAELTKEIKREPDVALWVRCCFVVGDTGKQQGMVPCVASNQDCSSLSPPGPLQPATPLQAGGRSSPTATLHPDCPRPTLRAALHYTNTTRSP